MQDRVSQYPGRVKLVPVEGQENVYDMERADGATVAGTPLNKANLLADATATALGLTSAATPNTAFAAIPKKINNGWTLLRSYATAGSYTWTVPATFGAGVSFKIGVLVIGGGGGGGAASTRGTSNLIYCNASGGASGYTASLVTTVSPGAAIPIVVGAGGAGGSAIGGTYGEGSAGGSSSFNGIVAEGGGNGTASRGVNEYYASGSALGAQGSFFASLSNNESTAPFGGVQVTYYTNTSAGRLYTGIPTMCINPFTNTRILGAGGWAAGSIYADNDASVKSSQGGKDPLNAAYGGGNGAATQFSSGTVSGGAGNQPGCGGGGAVLMAPQGGTGTITAIGGAGAPGAVYIYVQGK